MPRSTPTWSLATGAPGRLRTSGSAAGRPYDVVDVKATHKERFRRAVMSRGLPETAPLTRSGRGGMRLYVAPRGCARSSSRPRHPSAPSPQGRLTASRAVALAHDLEPSAVADILILTAREAGLPEREARLTFESGPRIAGSMVPLALSGFSVGRKLRCRGSISG